MIITAIWLAVIIFCPYTETQNPDINSGDVAVYYRMSVDRSRKKKLLRYVRIVAALLLNTSQVSCGTVSK